MQTIIRGCAAPRAPARTPLLQAPPGSWDTHFHVLGPLARFPYAADRRYTPPEAPLEDYLRLMEHLGLEYGIVVQPNLHGYDNRATLEVLVQGRGRFFGVVNLAEPPPKGELRTMHDLGVRGVRFAFNPAHGGVLDLARFDRIVEAIAHLGWFVELHPGPQHLALLADWIRRLPVRVVIDHFGRVDAAAGPGQIPFLILRQLLAETHVWVKLTGADRISRTGAPYADVVPLGEALLEVAPDRLVWGTDWPHTGIFDPDEVPDDSLLLDVLADLCPDAALRQRILVENPRQLVRA